MFEELCNLLLRLIGLLRTFALQCLCTMVERTVPTLLVVLYILHVPMS
jgi:hypothetical protein